MKESNQIYHLNVEIEKIFLARTKRHRQLVQNNLQLMQGYLDLPLHLLNHVAANHDLSKYNEPERTAYTCMTWKYHCKNKHLSFNFTDDIEALILQGWQHHILTNSHHPEAHSDPNTMKNIDLVEMVCDWTAIAQENDIPTRSCLEWAQLNIDKKWQFSVSKKKLIFAIIHELDNRIQMHNNS